MKKYLFLIVTLVFIIIFSYRYLQRSIDSKKTFVFRISSKPLLFNKRQLELDDPETFDFDEYFTILSNDKYQYKYEFTDSNLVISLNNSRYIYPYAIKEKEIEIITEYVIQEVYIDSHQPSGHEEDNVLPSIHSSEGINLSYDYESEYLNIINDVLSFETGTDLSTIIGAIQASIETDVRISVDYSALNPNSPGNYNVYIISPLGNYSILIEIF